MATLRNFIWVLLLCFAGNPVFAQTSSLIRIGDSLNNRGRDLANQEEFRESLDCLQDALPILRKANHRKGIATCMSRMADGYHAMGDFNKSIQYYDSSKTIYGELKDTAGFIYTLVMEGHSFYDLGDYRNAFTYGQSAEELTEKAGNMGQKVFAAAQLGNLFLGADLPQTAIDFMNRYIQVRRHSADGIMNFGAMQWMLSIAGEAFLKLNQIDSAVEISQMMVIDTGRVEQLLFRGRLEMALHHNEKAISLFKQGYSFSLRHDHPMSVAWHAIELAKAYYQSGKYALATSYAKEALQNALQIHALQEVRNAYHILGEIYASANYFSKAYYYNHLYKTLSDSLAPDEYRRVLALIEVQHELTTQKQKVQILSRENLLKESNLKQEITLRNEIIAGGASCLVIGLLFARNIQLKRKRDQSQRIAREAKVQLENREKEQRLAELEREKSELEMQALRAQMNPHFIFNCLSSINRFILKNETDAASDYLTKFSRLIRMVLINSQKAFIVLEDELECLRLYLDMERLRFKESFDYTIGFTNSISLHGLFVPPLLLQPFVENAIWHGLMHKEGPKKLSIELSLVNGFIHCVITDNGIGREKAASFRSNLSDKQKSLGLQITRNRLNLLNEGIMESFFFEIHDIRDNEGVPAGTRVLIRIPCRDHAETFV